MADRDSVESAFLQARAKFLTWIDEVNKQWQGGQIETAIGLIDNKLSSLPPDVQARSRSMNPEQWKAVDERNSKRKNAGGK
jgi:hypothetical protein